MDFPHPKLIHPLPPAPGSGKEREEENLAKKSPQMVSQAPYIIHQTHYSLWTNKWLKVIQQQCAGRGGYS